MGANSNYPMGVDGTHPHFDWPDPPECPECYAEVDADWLYCPWCGARLEGGDAECS